MTKDAVENVVTIEEPIVAIDDYTTDERHWDDWELHKEYIINNTVGLKTGHNNKARYYVVRAPQSVVKTAYVNSYISHKNDDEDGNNPALVTSIFTFYLYRPSKGMQKRRYVIGVTDRIDDQRTFYSLTGSLRQIRVLVDDDEARFKRVLNVAVTAAEQWGITGDQFSNQLGLNRKEYMRLVTDVTGQNSPHFAGYDVESELTNW